VYHYLKWALVALFWKRNLKYLLLILLGVAGIYLSDALYGDMVEYAAVAHKEDEILKYLAMKWLAVILFIALILWSISRLGFDRALPDIEKRPKKENDPYLNRMEKFLHKKSLDSKSEKILKRKASRKRR